MSHPLFLLGSSLFFSFFLITSYSDDKDSFAGNCPSHPCGNVNISYPFWRIDTTTSTRYCGYPGLGLECSSTDQVFLNLSNNPYNVRNINYDQKNLNLVSINVTGNQSCPRARNNLTLDTNSVPLFHSQLDLNLTFYFNCTDHPTLVPPISCLRSGEKESYVLAGLEPDVGADWSDSCEEKVVTKVLHREMNINTYYDLINAFGVAMSNGFVLDLGRVPECGACELSHGRCGYDNVDNGLLCFRPNGTIEKIHRKKVHPQPQGTVSKS